MAYTSKLYSPSLKKIIVGTQDSNFEAGNEAETIEECCLLDCSICFLIEPTVAWALPYQSLI